MYRNDILYSGASIHFDKAQCGAILLLSNHSATTKFWYWGFDTILLLSNHSATTKIWYWGFDTILLLSNHSATTKIWSFRIGASIHFDKAQCGAILLLSNHLPAFLGRQAQPPLRFGRFVLGLRYDSPAVESLSHRLKFGR